MAGPNAAMLLSSKGGAFNSAQFVAGSRRKSSSSKKKSCARAGFFSKDDDFETSAEAAIIIIIFGRESGLRGRGSRDFPELGGASRRAVVFASSVGAIFFLATMCIFLFLLLVEKKDRIVFSPFWI